MSEMPTLSATVLASLQQIVGVDKVRLDDEALSTFGTDWTKVNIQALRDHLVDMELVTTQATVNTQTEGRIVEFRVTGERIVADAVARMATAHSPMLELATGWTVTAEPSTDGATMRIEVQTEQELARVLGLGFFGVMAIGAHHQAHHIQMASGEDPHH